MLEIERHTDPLDIASRNEELATADSIRIARAGAVPQQFPDDKGEYLIRECVECGNDIGVERLRVAVKNLFCVECVNAREVADKRRGR